MYLHCKTILDFRGKKNDACRQATDVCGSSWQCHTQGPEQQQLVVYKTEKIIARYVE